MSIQYREDDMGEEVVTKQFRTSCRFPVVSFLQKKV
jgi:hypothetical protein